MAIKYSRIPLAIYHAFLSIYPIKVFYASGFSRKFIYRLFYLTSFCYFVGLFRKPMIARSVLRKQQTQKTVQQETMSQTLAQLQIKLSDYQQKYYVIVVGHCLPNKEEELVQKQKIAFQLNNQIKERMEINGNYFADVKFLFIGSKEIYELLEENRTVMEFYEKETTRSQGSMIYILGREEEGEKLISVIPYKSDLKSIIRIISKHKARTFARQIQFS